jgi:hypothetical protein
MSNTGTLTEKLDEAGIKYTRTTLAMGSFNSEACYLVHYTTKSGVPMTVFVFPQAGIDSWAEEYYHFANMTIEDALKLSWYEVYEHVHRVSMETAAANAQVAQYCPKCEKAPVNTYDDLRGLKRCVVCHSHTADNKAEYWR